MEAAVQRRKEPSGNLYCVFGADQPTDKREAEAIAAICPATLVPVEGCRVHNVLQYVFFEGRLAALFDEIGLTRLDTVVAEETRAATAGVGVGRAGAG
jgi:hypothetical protein